VNIEVADGEIVFASGLKGFRPLSTRDHLSELSLALSNRTVAVVKGRVPNLAGAAAAIKGSA